MILIYHSIYKWEKLTKKSFRDNKHRNSNERIRIIKDIYEILRDELQLHFENEDQKKEIRSKIDKALEYYTRKWILR
jgi:transposase